MVGPSFSLTRPSLFCYTRHNLNLPSLMDLINSSRRSLSSRASTTMLVIKFIAVGIAGLIGAAIPAYIAYNFWAWSIALVPAANEWAGLIKLGVTLLLIALGGGFTVFAAMLLGFGAAALVAKIVE